MKLVYHKGKVNNFRLFRKRKLEKKLRQKHRRKDKNQDSIQLNPQIRATLKEKKSLWSKERKRTFREFFRNRSYSELPKTVKIEQGLGIEENLDRFLDKAEEFIGADARSFSFDLRECTRLWPSAVILLCSLVHWCQLTSGNKKFPKLGSVPPNRDEVNRYLTHCGFYDYVLAKGERKLTPGFTDDGIVKIKKETIRSNLEHSQREIFELVKRFSAFNEDGLEWFDCVVLTEILNNVTEHGVHNQDFGWFNLCQYHPTTGIISICIADNGPGIKNSLITGPQRKDIIKILPEKKANDGDFIQKAFDTDVSGAYFASTKKKGIFKDKYSRGARRGYGLKRIQDRCKVLKIPLTVISQYGVVAIDENGKMSKPQTRSNKVFAGTLYHLQVPAKQEK